MMIWLLLVACSCSKPEVEAPPPPGPSNSMSTSSPDDAPPEPVEGDDLARTNAIGTACAHIETCGCADQTVEQCAASSERSALPTMVYICIDRVPCEKVCAIGPAGTPGKGTVECVEPYIKSQVGGGGTGLKKRAGSDTRMMSHEDYDKRVDGAKP